MARLAQASPANDVLLPVGRRLASDLEAEATVDAVVALAVPALGDWCALHVLAPDGAILPLAVAHADGTLQDLVRTYTAAYPPRTDDAQGAGAAIRRGEVVRAAGITEARLRATVLDPKRLELVLRIAPRSYVSAPLRSHGRIIGALTVCHAESGRDHDDADVRRTEHLAHLAAAALDNARLYREEQKARALLVAQNEAAPDGIFFQGSDGRTAFYNDRLLAMWGVDASVPGMETMEARLAAVTDRFEDPESFTRLAREVEGRHDRTVRFDVRVKGGRVFECNTAPVADTDGTYLGRVWYYRDVTAHRALEDALAQARRALAETEKLAVAGTLVSGVAHEIRTPLTYVANHAHLLSRWVESSRAAGTPAAELEVPAKAAEAFLEGVDRMNRLVAELRRFVRTPRPEAGEVDVDDAVRAAALLFQATHRGRAVVEASYGGAGRVPLDKGQVEQVVLNLLENASDASPPGGRVRVATGRTAAGTATIVVQDWGVGMAPEVQARIFEPFFTTKAEGMGLGLGIVQRVVDAAGGRVQCETTPGNGTTFTLELPRARDVPVKPR